MRGTQRIIFLDQSSRLKEGFKQDILTHNADD